MLSNQNKYITEIAAVNKETDINKLVEYYNKKLVPDLNRRISNVNQLAIHLRNIGRQDNYAEETLQDLRRKASQNPDAPNRNATIHTADKFGLIKSNLSDRQVKIAVTAGIEAKYDLRTYTARDKYGHTAYDREIKKLNIEKWNEKYNSNISTRIRWSTYEELLDVMKEFWEEPEIYESDDVGTLTTIASEKVVSFKDLRKFAAAFKKYNEQGKGTGFLEDFYEDYKKGIITRQQYHDLVAQSKM